MNNKSLLPFIALAMMSERPDLFKRKSLNIETINEKEKRKSSEIDIEKEMELIKNKRSNLSPELRRIVKRRYKAIKKGK